MKRFPKIHLNHLRKLRRLSAEFLSEYRLIIEANPQIKAQFSRHNQTLRYEIDEFLVDFVRFVEMNSRRAL